MVAKVGTLRADVVANTSKFNGPLKKSQRSLAGFGKSILSVGKKLTSLGGIAGGLSLGGFAMMIKSQMTALDKMAKFSDQIGIQVGELQKLRHAAELTGAGADTLDAGLSTMAKRLGEAARGSGAATAALGELGLSAQELIGMSPDEQFRAIAKALKQIEEPARRNAIAANIFSKANMALVNTLAQGEDGLRAMGAELEQLGGVFSREELRQIEEANDNLTRLATTLKTQFAKMAVELAPQISALTKEIMEFTGALITLAAHGGVPVVQDAPSLGSTPEEIRRNARAATKARGGVYEPLAIVRAREAQERAIAAETSAREALVAALTKDGDKLREAMRTPAEIFAEAMDKYRQMLSAGVIDLETFDRAVAAARDKLPKPEEVAKAALPQYMAVSGNMRGSASAYSAIQEARHQQATVAKQQLAEQKNTTDAVERLARNLSRDLNFTPATA